MDFENIKLTAKLHPVHSILRQDISKVSRPVSWVTQDQIPFLRPIRANQSWYVILIQYSVQATLFKLPSSLWGHWSRSLKPDDPGHVQSPPDWDDPRLPPSGHGRLGPVTQLPRRRISSSASGHGTTGTTSAFQPWCSLRHFGPLTHM